jgi:glycosyltransferase involved in cell wall biosynthesis
MVERRGSKDRIHGPRRLTQLIRGQEKVHSSQTSAAPFFSIVTAVYNAAPYLNDLFSSVQSQSFPPIQFELILIDDGSTDESLEMCERWKDQLRCKVTVLSKTNGGQGSARNLGIKAATGTWVVILDSDDILDRSYLMELSRAILANPDTSRSGTKRQVNVVSTQPIIYHEGSKGISRHRYGEAFSQRAPSIVNLLEHPASFPIHPGVAYRASALRQFRIAYDERVRPIFEDMLLTATMFIKSGVPRYLVVPRARFLYRKRSAQNSSIDISAQHPGRHLAIPKYGYLPLMRFQRKYPQNAEWIHNLVITDAGWIVQDWFGRRRHMIASHHRKEHVALMRELGRLSDVELVRSAQPSRLQHIGRDLLALGLGRKRTNQPLVGRSRNSAAGTEVVFYTMPVKARPSIRASVNQSKAVKVTAHKLRKILYWGEHVLMEHRVTLETVPDAGIQLLIDGKRAKWWRGGVQIGSRWTDRLRPPDGIGVGEGFVGPTHVEAIRIGIRNSARIARYFLRKVASSVVRRIGISALFARRT